jgi:diguanylate cyclase (GGDEF)-like protein
MRVIVVLLLALLVWCLFALGPWVWLPLGALLLGAVIAPIVIRRSGRPEYWESFFAMFSLSAVAVAAAMTGGPLSPIAYLLPMSLVINATRVVPRASLLTAAVVGGVFLLTCLLGSPASVQNHPLDTAAWMVAFAAVTIACAKLSSAELAFRTASVLDPLTGLLNRLALDGRYEELREQARLVGAPICLVLFDLDAFKAINDRYGHDVGDAVLREVAYEVRKTLRKFELIYRMGGEEFLVVLPGMTESQGVKTAWQLGETMRRLRVDGQIGVTASFGVSAGSGDDTEFGPLYRDADQALYRAKRDGRDRVVAASRQLAVTDGPRTGAYIAGPMTA